MQLTHDLFIFVIVVGVICGAFVGTKFFFGRRRQVPDTEKVYQHMDLYFIQVLERYARKIDDHLEDENDAPYEYLHEALQVHIMQMHAVAALSKETHNDYYRVVDIRNADTIETWEFVIMGRHEPRRHISIPFINIDALTEELQSVARTHEHLLKMLTE